MRRIATAALLLATLAVGGFILSTTPDDDRQTAAFVNTGAMNESVSVRTLNVTVTGVRGGAVVDDGKARHDTSGVWIVVRLRAVAVQKPTYMMYVAIRDAKGRTYRLDGRISQKFKVSALQPGIPVEGEFAFELPRDGATRTVFRIGGSLDTRLDAVAEVALPSVPQTTVDQWANEKRPLTLIEPKAV